MRGISEMEHLYDDVLDRLRGAHDVLAALVPAPVMVRRNGIPQHYRYNEKSIQQAIVQKLARYLSGLAAAKVLLAQGFIQEQAAMHRMLDEFGEDTNFLSYALIKKEVTEDHRNYLDWFYLENYSDSERVMETLIPRPTLPRKKIHGYLAREQGIDPDTHIKAAKALNITFSGFIHGASPQIMEMYAGNPPRFQLAGMRNIPLWGDYVYDNWNYYFRGISIFAFAASALGEHQLFEALYSFSQDFAKRSGREN